MPEDEDEETIHEQYQAEIEALKIISETRQKIDKQRRERVASILREALIILGE